VAGERIERRLAAILAADVAGYSRLMGADEVGTLAALRTIRREVIDPAITNHKGRIVKTTGDGLLVEFASAVDAVTCAVALQGLMAEPGKDQSGIKFRIGINVGDIIVEGGDLFGDGVNVAARVESECEPGGVCLSGTAFEQVRGKIEFAFDDLGEKSLKNIERPVRLYAARFAEEKATAAPFLETKKALALPDKPSIAVLPFTNMSADPEQEYFADGMVEDIITALSRSKSLFVIARNSSFTYKGRAIDIKQVGRELGVRYVLEGSVRKAGNKVRITGQLIDALTSAHLWADRFDSPLEDIFDLQDRVTESVIGAISPQLERAEIERAQRKPTESLQAYDYYLRGLAEIYRFTRDANLQVLELTLSANKLDPEFALSNALAAYSLSQRKAFGWSTDLAQEALETRRFAERALKLDRDDARVLAMAGMAIAYVLAEVEEASVLLARAVQLDTNLGLARLWMGWINVYLGDVDAAIEQFQIAIRVNPLDPRGFVARTGMAYAHFFAGRNEEAATWATTVARQQSKYLPAQHIMMACQAIAGRVDEARQTCAFLQRIDPTQRISAYNASSPFRRREHIRRLEEGFRIAGMPE
jgi:TolB-like protein/class 3 adenylate cyclase